MHMENGILRGLGENVFLIADPSVDHKLQTRDAGWCDKRAKGYVCEAGRPVATIVSASTVCRSFIVSRQRRPKSTPSTWPRFRTSRRPQKPQRSGDLVFEYRVEGVPRKRSTGSTGSPNTIGRCGSNSRVPGTSTATGPSK